MKSVLSRISELLFTEPSTDGTPRNSKPDKRETWQGRPPVVVVCPQCNSGIFQNRIYHPIDCPDCDFKVRLDYLTEYDIIRFDCPDCGADIEDRWATRDLVGNGPPNTVVKVHCDACGMGWEAPSNY